MRLPMPAAKPSPTLRENDVSSNEYADVPFDKIRAEMVGGIPREDVEAMRSSARLLLRQYEGARCDDEGVAGCIRCNSVFLAKRTLAALVSAQTVPEMARAYVTEHGPAQ